VANILPKVQKGGANTVIMIVTDQKTNKKAPMANHRGKSFVCGGREIRTPGTFQYDGFQDRSIKPLWHSSVLSKAGAKIAPFRLLKTHNRFFSKKVSQNLYVKARRYSKGLA
jgi:hypothetical protein